MSDEFRTFFEDYAATYDAFDVDRMVEFVHCPMVTVREGEPSIHETPDQIHAFFTKLLEWFRGIQHGKASITKLEARKFGPKSAFADLVWRSTRADGSKYTEWPTAYYLVNTGSGWRILTIVLRYEPAREVSGR
ncbi:MAG: DUF6841 family protein [Burkholderiales bacterium]